MGLFEVALVAASLAEGMLITMCASNYYYHKKLAIENFILMLYILGMMILIYTVKC